MSAPVKKRIVPIALSDTVVPTGAFAQLTPIGSSTFQDIKTKKRIVPTASITSVDPIGALAKDKLSLPSAPQNVVTKPMTALLPLKPINTNDAFQTPPTSPPSIPSIPSVSRATSVQETHSAPTAPKPHLPGEFSVGENVQYYLPGKGVVIGEVEERRTTDSAEKETFYVVKFNIDGKERHQTVRSYKLTPIGEQVPAPGMMRESDCTARLNTLRTHFKSLRDAEAKKESTEKKSKKKKKPKAKQISLEDMSDAQRRHVEYVWDLQRRIEEGEFDDDEEWDMENISDDDDEEEEDEGASLDEEEDDLDAWDERDTYGLKFGKRKPIENKVLKVAYATEVPMQSLDPLKPIQFAKPVEPITESVQPIPGAHQIKGPMYLDPQQQPKEPTFPKPPRSPSSEDYQSAKQKATQAGLTTFSWQNNEYEREERPNGGYSQWRKKQIPATGCQRHKQRDPCLADPAGCRFSQATSKRAAYCAQKPRRKST